MLRIIFNKLNMVDMLYSLVDVNQRFDRLAFDSLYIDHLDLVIKQDDIHNFSIDTHILDRICSKILPRINNKVTKFTLEPLSMERVFGTVHYPQLHSLSFINFQPNILSQHLLDETIIRLLENQITHITVDIKIENVEKTNGSEPNTFLIILLLSKCLNDLTYLQKSSRKYITILSSNISYIHCLSSTLTKLTINVNYFDDCLYLLNGCLQSLSTLIIRINDINRSSSMIDNTKKLVKLKCFSLATDWRTFYYDNQVVPLLRRMLNIEELTLFLSVLRPTCTYIDGNQLYDEVLNYMPRLNKFIFSIHTCIINYDIGIDRPSNDDIRNSFISRGIQSFDTCFDDKFMNNRGNCHVYSLPYQFNDFLYMGSCFQGGRFDKVRLLSMQDERPFEHKLFQIISQDFPFLQQLTICNDIPQENEQHHSYTERSLNEICVSGLLVAVVLRTIQFNNMIRMRDKYLHTKIISLFDLLARKHVKTLDLIQQQQQTLTTNTSNDNIFNENVQDLSIIEDIMRMVLEIINSCLTHTLQHNINLIYTLLYIRDIFDNYRAHINVHFRVKWPWAFFE
ncbi:unnamed protein product [Rotaria sordida]|uniref:Dymeclin n=1 Tax=Rotaria sordida TaxID=392033 RepID=A0A818P4C5_9BILA|nr:unnamed protein product [Rotaria sordida]CAF3617269.1 unnamed protein product [Rotaria sordida]